MNIKNGDSPLYYQIAKEAAEIEQRGDYARAAKVWTKAHRVARNDINQRWSEQRADFCVMQLRREKLKNDLHP